MSELVFRYYGGGTERELRARSGEPCTIVRELGDEDRDAEVGRMFEVCFADGFECSAFEEELEVRAGSPATSSAGSPPESSPGTPMQIRFERATIEEIAAALMPESSAGSPPAPDLRRCRYSDCIEQHPVAAEDEAVSCETCREYMGSPPWAEARAADLKAGA